MSKIRRDHDFLLDIEDAIGRILEYTTGMNWGGYLRDYKTQDAVVRNLEVIGEATKNLVWQIVEQDLPVLKSQIEQVIREFPEGDS